MTVTADIDDPFIRGTEHYITCNVTLNAPLPVDTSVDIEWTRDGMTFNNTDRVFAVKEDNYDCYSSTITFSPLNTTDSGTYECTGTVNADIMNDNIASNSNSGQLLVKVEGNEMMLLTL